MKIAHVVPALTRGGGERVVVILSNLAAAAGHDVTVIAFADASDGIADQIDRQVRIVYIGSAQGRLGRYASALPWLRRNWHWIAELDVLHCHMTAASALGAMIHRLKRWKGSSRPAVVETYHAVGMPIPRWHRWVHARLASRRDALALMATDDFWGQFVMRNPRLVSAVIPNGIAIPDVPKLKPEDRRETIRSFGIPDSAQMVVGTVGRLAPARQPWRFPDIFAAIARSCGPDVHFILGGEGPERDRVEEAVVRAGLQGRVHMPGLVRNPFELYPALDLYLTLNVGAITGVAGMEAAAAGVPVLALQLLEDHRPGPDDWIWSSDDELRVAQKAVDILGDRDASEALARSQRSYIAAHRSDEAMAKAYEQLYAAAIEAARANCRR